MNQIINIDLNKNSDLSDEKIEKTKILPKKFLILNSTFLLLLFLLLFLCLLIINFL